MRAELSVFAVDMVNCISEETFLTGCIRDIGHGEYIITLVIYSGG